MQLQKGQTVEFDVERLAFGGAGIGKYQGMTVFVDGAMPGDRVRGAFCRIKPKFAEVKLIDILKPSSDRLEPRCKYAGVCGGCQLQHMPYEQQLAFKRQHVVDAFERIGKIYSPPVEEIIGCEEQFHYRNKMEFSFGYDAGMNFSLGLHLPDRRYDILNLDMCWLQSEFSVKIVNAVRDFMISRGWAPFKYSNGEGFLRSLFIREGKRTGEMMINLTTSEDVPEDLDAGLKDFVEMLLNLDGGTIVSVYWSQVVSRRGVPKKIKEKLLHGKVNYREKMILKNGDELNFDILPQSFFQVNTKQAEILYSQVLDFALEREHEVVFDLFCGTGTIGLFLAGHVERVFGVEVNEDAVKNARENAQKNGIFNIDFFIGDVGKVLCKVRERPSLIVVDPPRAGLTEKIIGQMNEFGADRIVYVSCNPSTLARDCAWLGGYGYKVVAVKPVDMFPHTFHIENVCLLAR